MAQTSIKDGRGQILGYLEEGASGETKVKDRQGCILGYYDPNRNVTFYKNGTKYAEGNDLRSMLR